jgi:hypothetical protein
VPDEERAGAVDELKWRGHVFNWEQGNFKIDFLKGSSIPNVYAPKHPDIS